MSMLVQRLLTVVAMGSALWWGTPALAEEGALSQLYAPRPPAGAAYVRVVQPQNAMLAVRVATGASQQLGGKTPAGSYAIVQGGQSFGVQVQGKEVARLQVRPDSFNTLVLRRSGAGYAVAALDDTDDTQDALKAQLRYYNLSEGCTGAGLALAPSGSAVFSSVARDTSAARSVNPVRADLVASCGDAKTPAQALPALAPGDHLSIFLLGTAAAPRLVMQANRTDPFKR